MSGELRKLIASLLVIGSCASHPTPEIYVVKRWSWAPHLGGYIYEAEDEKGRKIKFMDTLLLDPDTTVRIENGQLIVDEKKRLLN